MTDSKADQPQINKFRDLAGQLEAEEDEARLKETVRKIALKPDADKARTQSE